MKEPLVFITSNKNKLLQVQAHLKHPIEHIDLELTEIQSLDPVKVAEHKAKEAYQFVKKPVLIEDTSLTFHALGKLPGPMIKWFLESVGPEGLCRLLDNYEDRSAVASVTFALYDGESMKIFHGEMQGEIAKQPRGEGFGWTPIFIPKGWSKSYGEMTKEEQKQTSMRRIAVDKINKYIKEHYEK